MKRFWNFLRYLLGPLAKCGVNETYQIKVRPPPPPPMKPRRKRRRRVNPTAAEAEIERLRGVLEESIAERERFTDFVADSLRKERENLLKERADLISQYRDLKRAYDSGTPLAGTLRDTFAAAAMEAHARINGSWNMTDAKWCYAVADDMLKARDYVDTRPPPTSVPGPGKKRDP